MLITRSLYLHRLLICIGCATSVPDEGRHKHNPSSVSNSRSLSTGGASRDPLAHSD